MVNPMGDFVCTQKHNCVPIYSVYSAGDKTTFNSGRVNNLWEKYNAIKCVTRARAFVHEREYGEGGRERTKL